MNIADYISESLETIFWVKIHKFFDADPDPGSGIFLTLDPGWKIFGSGINILDPQHWALSSKAGGRGQKEMYSIWAGRKRSVDRV
jgi:hypothetical protein